MNLKALIFTATLVVCLASCSKENASEELNIIYSSEYTDAKTQKAAEEIIETGYKIYTADSYYAEFLEQANHFEYDDYDGVIPEYEFAEDTTSFRTEKNFKTLVVGKNKDAKYSVMYIHGGAWLFQIAAEHLAFVEDVNKRIGANSYVPLYPMLPRWNSADAFEMLLEVYSRLLRIGKPVILMGDSAGANIVFGFAFYLKAHRYAMPECLVGLSPALDLYGSNPLVAEYDPLDIYINSSCIPYAGPLWAGSTPVSDPSISPIYGDPTGFPKTLIYIGNYEILYPDVMDYARNSAAKGVRTTVYVGRKLWHVAPLSDIPFAEEFKQYLARFID